LQQAVIPGIRSQIRAIQQALDQQEQEDIFRLKRIKGKIAKDSLKRKNRVNSLLVPLQ
jgi:V/A-type H+-transporting ATPase subunit D